MKRTIPFLSVLLLVISACSFPPVTTNPDSSSSSSDASVSISSSPDAGDSGDLVIVSPLANAMVESPLTVSGKARGAWYFEGSFPVRLLDDQDTLLEETPAQAQGDWMTADYVPFTATLTFTTARKNGTLLLKKDNPSGLPENDRSVSIPVRFP
ncbi:TPA: hypothetical protein DCL30_01905 [Candidatus Peribacteria bacterium]|nr:MAG: hypothetical protein A3J91_03600 [Candidatus Peribacteria bacterium RIFOXYC2_FULL_58_10]OGJ85275.1 MAG: hypothetical protein A2529_02315 [Candidatus Peribacteria bacterium RIFOXYD2_FULL_58_15]HAI98280.1 hypothetical protein [Candidatus Peribacteria bacterium]HAS33971.1 hypothetical protein [Candidatus Peribacteria bacterium]